MTAPAVRVHIDSLVLHGFGGVDAGFTQALTQSLERELAALLAQRQWRTEGLTASAHACLRAPALRLPRESGPTRLGQALAGALHELLASRDGVASEGSSS